MTKFLLILVWLNPDPAMQHYRFSEYAQCVNSRQSFAASMAEQGEVVLMAECFAVPPSWKL